MLHLVLATNERESSFARPSEVRHVLAFLFSRFLTLVRRSLLELEALDGIIVGSSGVRVLDVVGDQVFIKEFLCYLGWLRCFIQARVAFESCSLKNLLCSFPNSNGILSGIMNSIEIGVENGICND